MIRVMAAPTPLDRRMISWPRLVPGIVMVLVCFLLTWLARTRRQRVVAGLQFAGVILFLVAGRRVRRWLVSTAASAAPNRNVGGDLHDYGYRDFHEPQHYALPRPFS
jgi:hypothetical protein